MDELGDLGRRGLDEADELGAQFVEGRQRGQGLDAIRFRAVLPIAPPRMTSLSLALAKSTATLGAATGSLRIGQQRRALQKGPDRGDVRAFESDLGEAVLGDLHGGAGLPHLRTQLLHVGDREAGIVSDDDDAGVVKHRH